MKTILISCLVLIITITASAQPKPLNFSMAIKADDTISPKELYKRGKFWFSDIFDASNKRLTLDNPEQGVIVGTAAFPYSSKVHTGSAKTKGMIEYQVKLRFREARYEYEITDFRHKGSEISFGLITQDATYNSEIAGVSQEWKNEVWDDVKSQIEAHTKTIIKSIITEISKPE